MKQEENLISIDDFAKVVYENLFSVLLTDRGSEFSAADAMETRGDGSKRTNLFYCDPMQSCQKRFIRKLSRGATLHTSKRN